MRKVEEVLKDITKLSREDRIFVLDGLLKHEDELRLLRVGDVRRSSDGDLYQILGNSGNDWLCLAVLRADVFDREAIPGWEPAADVYNDPIIVRGPKI